MVELEVSLPAGKRTVLGLYMTAREAYERWRDAPGEVKIIDVRTPEECMFVGHAPMAWKIPVASQFYQWDAQVGRFPLRPLADFVTRVQSVARFEDVMAVMCRSGGRSAVAVNLLAEAGFRNVHQIVDGMEGDPVSEPDSVFLGQRLKNGWKNSGCPWTYELTPERLLWPKQPLAVSAGS